MSDSLLIGRMLIFKPQMTMNVWRMEKSLIAGIYIRGLLDSKVSQNTQFIFSLDQFNEHRYLATGEESCQLTRLANRGLSIFFILKLSPMFKHIYRRRIPGLVGSAIPRRYNTNTAKVAAGNEPLKSILIANRGEIALYVEFPFPIMLRG